MKTVLHILASLVASLAAFAATGLIVAAVVLGIYGDSPFEHDTRAETALGVLILVIALPIAIATFMFVIAFLHKRRKAGAAPHKTPLVG